MAVENHSVHLAKRPEAEIVLGETFSVEASPAPTYTDLQDGDILVETLYLSLDPALRAWLLNRRSYIDPISVGAVMRTPLVSRVLASKSEKAAVGDIVSSWSAMTEYAILKDGEYEHSSHYPGLKTPEDILSGLGVTSVTAWAGMVEIGDPKPGEVVVVSGAAGATGSIAGQIAKLKGATVIGIAGSDEKCRWLTEELGFDAALNYKSKDFKEQFEKATPNYIDLYFDNVGGEILDLALGRAKTFARFLICGMITQYNGPDEKPLRNLVQISALRIRMQGFLVLDYREKFPQARRELSQWLEEGKLKKSETIVKGGLEAVEQGLIDLFKGANTGKMIVEVKDPKSAPAQL